MTPCFDVRFLIENPEIEYVHTGTGRTGQFYCSRYCSSFKKSSNLFGSPFYSQVQVSETRRIEILQMSRNVLALEKSEHSTCFQKMPWIIHLMLAVWKLPGNSAALFEPGVDINAQCHYLFLYSFSTFEIPSIKPTSNNCIPVVRYCSTPRKWRKR